MQQQYEPEYQARHQLLQLERNRRDNCRRSLFWDAAEWTECFKACVNAEQRRDEVIQKQMATAGDYQQHEWLRSLYDAIDSDITWYRMLLNTLQATKEHWETDASVEQWQVNELLAHEALIEDRLYDRRIVLHQLSIECLERRRLAEGWLKPGVWTQHWELLQRAWYDQNLFYHRIYGLAFPGTMQASRLAWCQHIRTFQRSTMRAWGRDRSFNRQELNANATLLQAQMNRYSPKLRPILHWRRSLAIALIIGLFGLFLWFKPVSSVQLPENQGNAAPLPTAEPIRGIFSQLSANTPTPVASPSSVPTATLPSRTTARSRSEQLNDQGIALMIKGNCEDAIGSFLAAIKSDPFFYKPPNNLAFCLFEAGDLPGAIAQWRRSIELKSDNADGYAGLGMALHHSGQKEAGQMHYRQALQINARYGNESWLRTTAFWSEQAINASAPLRAALR